METSNCLCTQPCRLMLGEGHLLRCFPGKKKGQCPGYKLTEGLSAKKGQNNPLAEIRFALYDPIDLIVERLRRILMGKETSNARDFASLRLTGAGGKIK